MADSTGGAGEDTHRDCLVASEDKDAVGARILDCLDEVAVVRVIAREDLQQPRRATREARGQHGLAGILHGRRPPLGELDVLLQAWRGPVGGRDHQDTDGVTGGVTGDRACESLQRIARVAPTHRIERRRGLRRGRERRPGERRGR
jgi:hypothetical protein